MDLGFRMMGRQVFHGECMFSPAKETKDLGEGYFWKLKVVVSHGEHEICAFVAAPNSSAMAFYENCGYEILPLSGTLREGSEVPVYPVIKDLMD